MCETNNVQFSTGIRADCATYKEYSKAFVSPLWVIRWRRWPGDSFLSHFCFRLPSLGVGTDTIHSSPCVTGTCCGICTRRFLAEPSPELYNSNKTWERPSGVASLSPLPLSHNNKGGVRRSVLPPHHPKQTRPHLHQTIAKHNTYSPTYLKFFIGYLLYYCIHSVVISVIILYINNATELLCNRDNKFYMDEYYIIHRPSLRENRQPYLLGWYCESRLWRHSRRTNHRWAFYTFTSDLQCVYIVDFYISTLIIHKTVTV